MTVNSAVDYLKIFFFLIHGESTSGNGTTEQCHQSKEVVYWHNITPKDNVSPSTAPANMIYRYKVRLRGIDASHSTEQIKERALYNLGDLHVGKSPT